ncbi:unnamed protein product [Effrenium voratum]|uniref:Uncharacterized protein n=1 Tax=Effrenium voratum TaxID=2562239 RepID=A0AA36MZH9_9DINO|nr:unnamed protein product [Effrenium voratum]
MANPSWLPSCFGAPMWVVKVSDFLNFEAVPCHEELQRRGLLIRREEGFFCIFVSHQWLSVSHPDPKGEQLPVLQRALRHLLGGAQIGTDLRAEFFGQQTRLSEQQRTSLKDGYIWMDWLSIPQRSWSNSFGPAGETHAFAQLAPLAHAPSDGESDALESPSFGASPSLASQADFIERIPYFVEMSNMFVILAPRCQQGDLSQCDFGSWSQRGWCRLELWCKMLSANVELPVVLVSAAHKIDFAMPIAWIDDPPDEGAFTYEADRGTVSFVMKTILRTKIRNSKADKKWEVYRYFIARYDTLLGRPPRQRTMEAFMKDFQLKSLDSKKGMCPLLCATLSGDVGMITHLCNAGADVNRFYGKLPEVYIFQSVSPLMLAVWMSWRTPEVAQTLLARSADATACSRGGAPEPVVGFCKSAALVELLVQHRADVNTTFPALAAACGVAAPTSVIASLLEHKAQVNPPGGGLGSKHPLSGVAYQSSVSSNALEVAKLLLDARADVNIQYRSTGVWRAGEFACRSALRLRGRGSAVVHFMAEWSTTPLGMACFFGCDELVELLLSARANPEIPNERGRTPIDLARSKSTLELIHHHQTTFSI